jgi:hypothetical protein
MKTIVTVKLIAEKKEKNFPNEARNCIEHFKQLKQELVFGTEKDVELRFLVEGGVVAPTTEVVENA